MSTSNLPDSKKPNLIVILGPTASGKTGWALKLCEKFNGEIVSADSRQIYREMNIGTGKIDGISSLPSPLLYKEGVGGGENIPQHMIDIVNPDEILTLPQYKKQALNCIYDIINRGKIPFLVGGTGLYISAIVDNLEIPEVEPDWNLRKNLEKMTLKEMQKELKNLDPETYKEIDLNNKRRLIRALEVCKITGKPFSKLRKKGAPLFNSLQIGIDISKENLHKNIDKRVDQMSEAGLEKEANELAKKYIWDLPSMSGIGYREFRADTQVRPYDNDAIFDEIKKHTRQYAKRQMTWF
ncbi:MAG: tRNA (adenosine(37)-N6)-dimethylallyltransferase MiaA, partial [bacterium]